MERSRSWVSRLRTGPLPSVMLTQSGRYDIFLTCPPLYTEMFDKQQANSIFWSPQGQFLVLAGLRRSVACAWGSSCDLLCAGCRKCIVCVCLQHEWRSHLRGHVRLHFDEHSRALHGLWRGVGPNRSLRGHLRLLVEPQGNAAPSRWGISTRAWVYCLRIHTKQTKKSFDHVLYLCVGGQRVLAVDISGPSPSEEQQRSLLSAALETQTSFPAQCRSNQGKQGRLYGSRCQRFWIQ